MKLSRRQMLAISGGMLLSGAAAGSVGMTGLSIGHPPIYGGWLNLPAERAQFITDNAKPFFVQQAGSLKGTGQNKQVLLWQALETAQRAKFSPRFQDIGDCVGQATALAADTLTAVQIVLHKRPELWKGVCSTEAIYAGSRIEIAEGRYCYVWKRGRMIPIDGSTGVSAATWLRDYGVLLRGKYGNIDLTKYRPDLAREWGSFGQGVPDELEPILKQHPVKTVTLVTSWEQCCDSIANGYPVVVCSNVGYSNETDAAGFLARGSEPWNHAMLIWGIDSASSRQGGCIANSWGANWISGPQHKLGTPPGCFWADARNIDAMLKQEDSLAISNYVGYRRQELDYFLV